MPLRRALVACAIVAGCHDDGLVIDVDVGTTGAGAVELFLADGCPDGTPCARALTPTGATCAQPGAGYARTTTASTLALVEPGGHTASFHLTALADTTIPVVAVVGSADGRYLASPIVRDVRLPASGGNRVAVTLTHDHVVRPASTACVRLGQPTGTGEPWTAIGLTGNPECLDFASVGSHPDGAYCAAATDAGASCVLGLRPCDASVPTDGPGCAALSRKVCLPASACPCVGGDCLGAVAAAATRIECELAVDAGGAPCAAMTVDVGAAAPALPCRDLGLGAPGQGLGHRAQLGGLALTFASRPSACVFSIAGAGAVAADQAEATALLAIETLGASVLLPLHLTVSRPATCPTAATACRVVAPSTPDPIWACAGG